MKKLAAFCIAVLVCQSVNAEESTDGYRKIISLSMNGTEWTHFYLDELCPQQKPYYSLLEERVNVQRFYSTAMAAYMAGKKIRVYWEPTEMFCVVTRLSTQ